MQHLHVFGIGIVARECVVEFAVERHHFAADRLEHLRREGAGGTVAACSDHLEPALELRPVGKIGDVTERKIVNERVGAAATQLVAPLEHDRLEPVDLVRAEGERAVGAHLHAGPAVVVVGGRHHRHARQVERKLREVSHRGERQADIGDAAARCH